MAGRSVEVVITMAGAGAGIQDLMLSVHFGDLKS